MSVTDTVADTAENWNTMRHLERFKKYGQTEKELTCNLFAEFYGTVLLKNSIYWYWCDCSVAGHLALRYKLISAGNDRQDRTISLCCVGNLGWTCTSGSNGYFIHSWKGIFYSQSSVFRCAKFGAAFGARMMYMVYSETINTFDEGVRAINEQNATGIIFASYPQAYLSNTGAFIDQISKNSISAVFGTIAATISVVAGLDMGSPVNPASDFGARIFASLIGHGIQLFTFHHYFFVVPLLAPIVGAVIGAYSYRFFIGLHIPKPVATKSIKINGKQIKKTD
ncbi:major intrinsic protein [Loa loa]|uniref:Major intrinsic protein n=1 Tax=Loa loa TaxID=7209 RepID=A0A1S0U980_LOALO|nr:major intrinsic protein [Loa loa]EFO26865.2 major intrinsic protein [Loa loa]